MNTQLRYLHCKVIGNVLLAMDWSLILGYLPCFVFSHGLELLVCSQSELALKQRILQTFCRTPWTAKLHFKTSIHTGRPKTKAWACFQRY